MNMIEGLLMMMLLIWALLLLLMMMMMLMTTDAFVELTTCPCPLYPSPSCRQLQQIV